MSLDKGRTVRFVLRAATAQAADGCPSTATITLSPFENWGALLQRNVEISSAKEQTVEGLAPGRYLVEVTKLGDTCFSAANPILDLRAAVDPRPIPVLVAAAGAIRGRLRAGAARPQDLVVVLVASDAIEGSQPLRIAFPDAESGFAFSGLRPGRYRIAANPAAEPSTARWVPDLARMREIEVLSGGSTDIVLPVPVIGERP